jgi:hypothetical protein
MESSGMFRRVALVRTDVSEELSASFIRVTKIGELGTQHMKVSHVPGILNPKTIMIRRRGMQRTIYY